mgnify:CR=1 FL=1
MKKNGKGAWNDNKEEWLMFYNTIQIYLTSIIS